ncbi:MAG: two-component system response regulator [Gemmatales bacterium]|nr:MAG: two-component system response regulator [Gemmatales bacterium]
MEFNGDASSVTLTVVDDEPLVLDMLVRAARSWRYECQAARSAEEAIKLLETRLTPIVVTDLNMPDKDGIWLVTEVHRRWPEIAVIVVTAGHDSDAAIKCLNAGANRYFLKPIKLDEFRHALESTLQTYRLQREHEFYRQNLERTVRRQTRQIRRNFMSSIDSLVRTLEARDPYTCGHSMRVRRYAIRLAEALHLDKKTRRELSLAAKLHDIGKIGVPEAILNKPDLLTEEEFDVVRAHPVIGERILAPVVRNPRVLAGIRGHHERIDGRGYPDGLAGDDIPLLARLLTVPDCFDALTTARAYRPALAVMQALDVLREGSGKQFEPHFVNVFVDLITAGPPLEIVHPIGYDIHSNNNGLPVTLPSSKILTKD